METDLIISLLNGDYTNEEIANKYNLEKCSICDQWNREVDLMDTEGMADGGIGRVCESCKGDM